jgi:DNA-binding beta-propeller fold protein YncE
MFTDIVRSTELAAEMGDRAWKGLVSRHNVIVRRALKRHGGRELDTAGDGFFAIFEWPGQAIECAASIIASLAPLGLQIRSSVHTGETEVMGAKVGGITVHVAARVLGRAEAGQILVTSTVRDVAAGSGIEFEDRGIQELKGVPGEWHLYSVAALPKPVEADAATDDAAKPARNRWRTALPFVALGGIGLIIGMGAAAITFLRPGDAPATLAANTIAGIDRASLEVVEIAPVGTEPIAVVEGFGSLWVANFGDRTIQRVDPTTGESVRIIALSASGNPSDLVIGGESLWAASSIDGVVARINPRTGGIKRIEVGVGVGALAFGEGWVWATNGQTNEVLRIDPQTERVERRVLEGDGQPLGVAVGEGWVWVAEHLGGRVARLDPDTMELVAKIPLRRGQPDRIAIGLGYVWVTIGSDDAVTRIDPETDAVTAIEAVGNGPGGIAADDEAVWVANALDGTLVRIDPQQAAITSSVELGFAPQAVALGADRIWVTLTE